MHSITEDQKIMIINQSMDALGIPMDMKTDPNIIQQVLRDMKLDDFQTTNKTMEVFFQNITIDRQPLKPMFENIKKGLINKHPAIIKFLEEALDKKWLIKTDQVQRAVHNLFVLERITSAMCNDHNFFLELQNHYKDKEKECGLNTRNLMTTIVNALKISRSSFRITKAISIDSLMIYFQLQRGLQKTPLKVNFLKEKYRRNKINFIEYKLLSPKQEGEIEHLSEFVRINIHEAGVTEFKNNFKDNAFCAYVLAEYIEDNPPHPFFEKREIIPEGNSDDFYESIVNKKNLFPKMTMSQNFSSLYTTWNLAFVVGNLKNLDLLIPKLLIPSLFNAKKDDFMGVRGISLWLSINHVLFRTCEKREMAGFKNKVEMAHAWEKINREYSINIIKEEINGTMAEVQKGYNKFYKHPLYNFVKMLKMFR